TVRAPSALASAAQEPEDDQGAESAGWPDGLTVVPEDGSEVCPTTPITATWPVNGDPTAVTLMVDGVDVTAQSQIGGDGTIAYQQPSLLSSGSHDAAISFPDADGAMQTYTWSFDVTGTACATAPSAAPPSAPEQPAGAPPSAPPVNPGGPIAPGAPPAGQAPTVQTGP